MFVHQRSVLPLATIKGDRKFFTCPSLSIVAAGPPAYPAGGILLGLASHRDSRLGDLDLNVEVSAARLPHSCELLELVELAQKLSPMPRQVKACALKPAASEHHPGAMRGDQSAFIY